MKGSFSMERKATTIVFGCGKGGVGKTTSCVCMSHILSKHGRNVLIIDTDHQGNASKEYGYFEDVTSEQSLSSYLSNFCQSPRKDQRPHAKDYIRGTEFENINIITGDPRLQSDELLSAITSLEVKMSINPFIILIQQIKSLGIYDFIMVDTHPSMDVIVTSTFQAADWILVPTTVTDNSLDGATNTAYFIDDLRDAGRDVKLAGVFFTMVNNRTELSRVNMAAAKETRFKECKVFESVISQAEDIKKAENMMRPASAAYPSCKAVKQYEDLTREVVFTIGEARSI